MEITGGLGIGASRAGLRWGDCCPTTCAKVTRLTQVEVMQVGLQEGRGRIDEDAKISHAAGELEAPAKLPEAAAIVAKEPVVIQLGYLQTLTKIEVGKNKTVIFPVPIDIFLAS